MSNFKISLTIFLVGILLSTSGQISISQIRNAGIKSEDDLRNLGVSDAEIQSIKEEIFGTAGDTQSSPSSDGEVGSDDVKEPVVNETPILVPETEQKNTNEEYTVFGQNIFESGYFTIKENSDRILPSPNYILGTGDRISITIWGASEFSNEFTLDVFGNITPSLVGRINLKGKTFEQAEQIVKARFGKVYNLSSSKIALSLTYSKVISVNIVGEVKNPGTYSTPSINSAFNLLSLAKGTTKYGSVRDIEIRRDGRIISTLDLYEFLVSPSKYSNTFLQDGDFIVVKRQKGVVRLDGEVKRPGLYEIKNNEQLTSIIEIAGGFDVFADKESVNIIGVDKGKLLFKSFDFQTIKENKLALKDGDIVKILRVPNLVHGMVEVKGAINVPGEYQFESGMKISDLVELANGINRNSYLKQAQLIRQNENLEETIIQVNLNSIINNPGSTANIELKEFDILNVFNKSEFNSQYIVIGTGALKKTGEIDFKEGLELNDLILELNGFKKEADLDKIEVERVLFSKKDSANAYVQIINLTYPADSNFKLAAHDIVNVRTLPEFQFQKTITITGEVKYPGEYSLNGHDDKLSDLIKRAGGLTNWAFTNGAKLNRKENNLGLLLMDLDHAINKSNSKFDYILKPGDVITIPKNTNVVSISGAIGYKNVNQDENIVNSPLHRSRRAQFYIKKYGGGYDERAKRKKVYVISSNGMVKESIFGGLIKPKIDPGDKIVVEYKPEKQKKEKGESVDWNRVIENATIKITGVLTLLILANGAFGN